MRYLYWALCFVGGVLLAFGILEDNVVAVIAGALVVLACPAAEWWAKKRGNSRAGAHR